MDPSKSKNESPNPATNLPPPDPTKPATPANLEGVQAIPMPPPSTSTPDLAPVNRREYLARPKVVHIEDTLKRFDALLDTKSKTNLQKLASEQRKARAVTIRDHVSCASPVPEVRPRPASAMDDQQREQYYRGLSEPKAYCLNDTLQRFGELLEDSRRANLEENVGKLLSARESSTSQHLKHCPSNVAMKMPPALGVPPPGYNALEVAKSSSIADPPLRILELTLERFGPRMAPETKKEFELKVQEFKAQSDLKFKEHTDNHARNEKQPEIALQMPKTLPADYDPVAAAETSKLSWPNQHVMQDTLTKFGGTLKSEATQSMRERIQDQKSRRQETHKQHLHDCKLPQAPRAAHVRPSPDYDPVAVAKASKISIPNKHILKDTLDHHGKVIKPEARKNMQQMIKDRDLDRKTTHKQHTANCKYMKKARAATPKRVAPPPGYNPAEVAKTSKVSRPNEHILKDTLAHYGKVLKPAARESMQKMIKDRGLERQTTHKQHLHDCKLQKPPRARDVRPSPDYDPVEVSKTSKVSRPNKHILQDTLEHYGPILKPEVRESMQRIVEALDLDKKSTHQRHTTNCHYMEDVLAATPPSFPPPPGYNTDEVAKTSKIAQPYRHRLQETLDRHGHSLPERAKEYLLKMLEEQRNLREVSTRCHRINCHLPEPPEPRVLHHAYSEKNIVSVIEKFKTKLKREAFDHLADNVFAHLPDLVLATDIAKLAKLDPDRQRLINVLYSTVASYNGKPLTAHDHELYVHLATGLASFTWDVIDAVQREKDAADKKEAVSRQEVGRNSMTTEIFGHLARDMANAQGDRNVLKRVESSLVGDALKKKDQAVPSF
ncbi:hypothetical protein quinque_000280 [Culex quinquefasciatus]